VFVDKHHLARLVTKADKNSMGLFWRIGMVITAGGVAFTLGLTLTLSIVLSLAALLILIRREILESYLKRIKEMEGLALAHDGVEKAYAIQAGRELRVIVESEKVDDKRAEELSFSIAQKIQDEMQYPGHIKVTVIREKRAISFAK
jgi:uncharacterized protein YacL (UPF0231 family)